MRGRRGGGSTTHKGWASQEGEKARDPKQEGAVMCGYKGSGLQKRTFKKGGLSWMGAEARPVCASCRQKNWGPCRALGAPGQRPGCGRLRVVELGRTAGGKEELVRRVQKGPRASAGYERAEVVGGVGCATRVGTAP